MILECIQLLPPATNCSQVDVTTIGTTVGGKYNILVFELIYLDSKFFNFNFYIIVFQVFKFEFLEIYTDKYILYNKNTIIWCYQK